MATPEELSEQIRAAINTPCIVRKPIAIAYDASTGFMCAVCDDGTIWSEGCRHHGWRRMPSIPQQVFTDETYSKP